jgi:large subunit ribosomal protein L23
MAKEILIKPIITEKADRLTDSLNQYSFIVDKKSNKIEIRKAKSRNTRAGLIKGRVSSYKKAIITLADGEEIDFFGDI